MTSAAGRRFGCLASFQCIPPVRASKPCLPVETCSFSSVGRECSSEHGSATFRLLFCGLILNDIPMLREYPGLDTHNIGGNPIYRSTETAKSPVHDHKVSLSHDGSRFVLQRWRDALDKIEKTLTARCDMSAVLNVVRGPVALGRHVVPFVEQSVKSLKNECLIFFLFSRVH